MATGRVPTTANSPLTTKGDLFGYSTSPARLAVGANGETIVANSSTATGLSYAENYAAGKNKIINGDMNIWQRGTSFSYTGSAATTFTADRFSNYVNGNGTFTFSRQTFTPGTAPVAGYESSYFARYAVNTVGTSNDSVVNNQKIEDVRTLAGQTITVSFWAKADSARTIQPIMLQNFGSGGSGSVFYALGNKSLTTSWQRFTTTLSMGSVSGKTIGTSSFLELYFACGAAASMVIDFWGIQVEAGSVATAFQTATGTIQGELAACQRYYSTSYKTGAAVPTAGGSGGLGLMFSYPANASAGWKLGTIIFPQRMRTSPTVTIYSYSAATTNMVSDATGADVAANSGTPYLISEFSAYVYNNSGGTIFPGQGGFICHFAASAEL